MDALSKQIAYFTMEIGIDDTIPTYSGGLGVLAGDTIKSFADIGLNACCISMLYRRGYFTQQISENGDQGEQPVEWNPETVLSLVEGTFQIQIQNEPVKFKVWQKNIIGTKKHSIPVYFIDTKVEGNSEEWLSASDSLYGGDNRYRLIQETVLGLGGIEFLSKHFNLSSDTLSNWKFHMNEGHAAFLTLGLTELIGDSILSGHQLPSSAIDLLKDHCVFTTHTPVPAGHDHFSKEEVSALFGSDFTRELSKNKEFFDKSNQLNMTLLAMSFSGYVNGVAKRHGEVSRSMFPNQKIHAITNGIHTQTWVANSMATLFDKHIPNWREDQHFLKHACELPLEELINARRDSKSELFQYINAHFMEKFDTDMFTIGFARRAATYKRADLLFDDVPRLNAMAEKFGGIQIVFAGKAHPKDHPGKQLIKNIYERAKETSPLVKFVYLPNYNMNLGKLITGGVDVWLNNPIVPLEASGTSGMKAAVSGVPSLSTLDGWWVEGAVHGVTGWVINDEHDGMQKGVDETNSTREATANNLYSLLEKNVLPCYYESKFKFMEIARNSISINGSHFHTQRMAEQYRFNAYNV